MQINLVVFGIDVEEQANQVQNFVAQMGLTFPTALDVNGDVSARYRVACSANDLFH